MHICVVGASTRDALTLARRDLFRKCLSESRFVVAAVSPPKITSTMRTSLLQIWRGADESDSESSAFLRQFPCADQGGGKRRRGHTAARNLPLQRPVRSRCGPC